MHILPCEQVRVMRRFIFSQFSPIKHQIFLVYTPVDSILITQNKVHVATKPCLQHLLGFCPLFFQETLAWLLVSFHQPRSSLNNHLMALAMCGL